jgi:hypothetical protein
MFKEAQADPTLTMPHVESHGEPDVMFTLPEGAVQRVVGKERFQGWEPFRQHYSKKRVRDALGISNDAAFIDKVLKACGRRERPTSALEDAMGRIFDLLARQTSTPR